MLGLAAVAAAAVMAFVGAGSASAARVCMVNTNPCPGASTLGAGATLSASLTGGNAKLKTSIGTVECTSSSTGGKLTNSGGGAGTPVKGTIETLSFKGCFVVVLFKFNCTVTTTFEKGFTAPASIEGSGGNGVMTVTSGEVEPGAHVECAGGTINCDYSTSSIVLDVNGGTSSTIKAVNEKLNRTGSNCPETSEWTATYNTHIHRFSPLELILGTAFLTLS